MGRKIECCECGKHLGEIEAGSKLRKGMVYMCGGCRSKWQAAKSYMRSKIGKRDNPFGDMFGDIFNQRY